MSDEVQIIRRQDDPPAESYEAVWRDALAILETAGPKAGFLLLTACDDGQGCYEARCAVSTGTDAILVPELVYLLNRNLEAM